MVHLVNSAIGVTVFAWLPAIAVGRDSPIINTGNNGLIIKKEEHDLQRNVDVVPTTFAGTRKRGLAKIDACVDGKWQQFRHWSIGSQSLTCGTACVTGVNSEFALSTPYTFTLPQGGGCFIVVDAFDASDRFKITDFGNTTVGTTSEPKGSVICGNDPEMCYSLDGMSKGSFYLGEGPHSIMITVAQGKAGSAFFRLTTDTSQCQGNSPPPDQATSAPTSQSSFPNNRPPIAKCKQSVILPARKDCATRANIDAGSYDPDDGDRIKLVQSPWGPYSVGTTNVTLTVTDAAGASDSCVTRVTVVDKEEISEESIDCGIADWHVQSCNAPMTFNAAYRLPTVSTPNVKKNGCPVMVEVRSNSVGVTCERCAGGVDNNWVENVDCRDIAFSSGSELSLTHSSESGVFMTWQLAATDLSGSSVLKKCGVCVDSTECRRMKSKNGQGSYLQRRRTAAALKCPNELPVSSDGSRSWPEQSMAELDNCAAVFQD